MKVGLIGYGNIGKYLIQKLNDDQLLPGTRITSTFSRSRREINGVEVYNDFQAFLDSDIEIVVEASSINAVKKYGYDVLKARKNLLIISVGAFADQYFYDQIQALAWKYERKVYLPSGAIGGLDILKAAKTSNQLDAVQIITRKPASSLIDEPLEEKQTVFDGTASEAIQLFPKNINVSIILSLAGIGSEQTRVKIIADPAATENMHCIKAYGGFGEMTVEVKNSPMPENPKTSHLAALSVLSTLKKKEENILIM
ncbi:aspartate dehydrogenase [Salicibibacter cibarius]|uniref:L-aspartate dehydrogenase n=1 Tax=Salicibibacter cibarius TaxID=2743000 RepID=A0A7T7CA82_9BACI|nr:aspartate dehydrogenase [Salicibibacter cibarius]QQK74449.1 aspartate dehydrogenase [Salicibibacter cibarius]